MTLSCWHLINFTKSSKCHFLKKMTSMPFLILSVSCSNCHCGHQLSVGPDGIHTGATWQQLPLYPQCASHLLPQHFFMNAEVWENKTPSYCLSMYIPEVRRVIPVCKPWINCWWVIFLPFSLWVHVSYDFSGLSKQSLLAVSFNNTSLHWLSGLPCSILLVPDFCSLGFHFLIGACTEPLAQGLILGIRAEALHLTHAFLTTLPLYLSLECTNLFLS